MTDSSCPICFYEFDEIQHGMNTPQLQIITPCDHIFHYRCLLQWGKTCPICRNELDITKYILRSTVYIHSGCYYKRFELNISYYDTLYAILQMIQEVSEIPFQMLCVETVHLRHHGLTVQQIIPDSIYDQMSKIMKMSYNDMKEFYISFRINIIDPLREEIDKNHKKYGFNRRSIDEFGKSTNILELRREHIAERDSCVLI